SPMCHFDFFVRAWRTISTARAVLLIFESLRIRWSHHSSKFHELIRLYARAELNAIGQNPDARFRPSAPERYNKISDEVLQNSSEQGSGCAPPSASKRRHGASNKPETG